ncbi:MAG: fluoride efflux transporter CrcB [Elusimicrobiales bacterium]|nr:fluoride efflux transporter CrcB [Elusimicrobiales bacterium]
MIKFFYVAVGGAAGSVLRYALSGAVQSRFAQLFPFGTLAVNLAGAFAAGFLWYFCERTAVPPEARALMFVGVLGGFTTFSAFALENFHLLRDGEAGLMLANLLATNAAGVALVFAGFWTAQYLLKGAS